MASPTHPSAQDDVGTIAARAQTANAQAEGFGELGLVETLCPFQLFYGDGVERLGAESAREREPEHHAEDSQPALPGTQMWGGRSLRDRPGEAVARTCEGPEALRAASNQGFND